MINKKLKLFLIIIVVSILVCLYLVYSINPWKVTTSKASLLSEVPKKYRPDMIVIYKKDNINLIKKKIKLFLKKHNDGLVVKPSHCSSFGEGVVLHKYKKNNIDKFVKKVINSIKYNFKQSCLVIIQEILYGNEYTINVAKLPNEDNYSIWAIANVTEFRKCLSKNVSFSDRYNKCPGNPQPVPKDYLVTKKLTNSCDKIAKSLDNWYYGRYDIMAESDEHLKKGIFKMIEVNGNMSGFFGNGTKSYVRCQTDYLLKVGMPIAINNIFNGRMGLLKFVSILIYNIYKAFKCKNSRFQLFSPFQLLSRDTYSDRFISYFYKGDKFACYN